jgi:hypothetical protein
MFASFGWKAGLAVLVNATVISWLLRRQLEPSAAEAAVLQRVPGAIQLIHLAFLAGVVMFAHHPVVFLGMFLFFMGFTQAYERHQSPLILK